MSYQNQEQIKKLEEKQKKADSKIAEAIAKKIEVLKTNKPVKK